MDADEKPKGELDNQTSIDGDVLTAFVDFDFGEAIVVALRYHEREKNSERKLGEWLENSGRKRGSLSVWRHKVRSWHVMLVCLAGPCGLYATKEL